MRPRFAQFCRRHLRGSAGWKRGRGWSTRDGQRRHLRGSAGWKNTGSWMAVSMTDAICAEARGGSSQMAEEFLTDMDAICAEARGGSDALQSPHTPIMTPSARKRGVEDREGPIDGGASVDAICAEARDGRSASKTEMEGSSGRHLHRARGGSTPGKPSENPRTGHHLCGSA